MSTMEEALETSSRKRKHEHEESDEERESKIKLFALEPLTELLDLADEVLVEILLKLDGESLHNLALTCTQLKLLAQEKKLWNHAAFTSRELDIWEIMKRLKYLLVTTKTLKIQGDCKKEKVDERPLPNRQTFKTIINKIVERSPLIEHLHFSQIWFDWTKDFSISRFPANLRSLSFKSCIMPRPRSHRDGRTFSGIVEHMPHLQELRLEYCNFFESNELMPFSKIKELKTLSLRGCSKMRNCVPYLSLACRFGFTKLEVLDLRETNICDGELQCLNAVKTLKQLFLEQPDLEQSTVDSDDDDDDFSLYLRGPRRPTGRPPLLHPRPAAPPQESPSSPSNSGNNIAPLPSTSANNEATARPNPIDPPSSPESFSDSVSSSSGPEESQMQAIVIRANISSDANEPRIQDANGIPISSNHRLGIPERQRSPVLPKFFHSRYLQFGRNQEQRLPLSISDRGMLGFGVPRPNIMANLVFIGNQGPDPNTYLERIILRNFRNITDITLRHFETNAPRLTFLDIRGCSQISREAVEQFKASRTDCELLSNYDYEE